ncbi:MAG TPA: hypothetical protein VFF47_07060 [Nitrospirota bacterium]|nr:hypothetical protein [Nitrospirota bacterium]
MKDITQTASLLTYLESNDKRFYIKLSPSVQNSTNPEKTVFPFLIINESDPLARLIEAQVVSDAGSEVKKMTLLVQREESRLREDELWPVNNRDVNDSWQKAFSFYVKQGQDSSFILLSEQIGNDGGLLPLSSLFYCKTKKVFFHPPCPKCGGLLQQCEDDALLKGFGLHPFSGSLKRYLFCPACSSPDLMDFYVHKSGQSDPQFVKDRWTLVSEFGLLRTVKNDVADFPCIDCQFHKECYESGDKAVTRIIPFSFYPFYMFVFEAMSLNGLDFISLLSGATYEELETLLENKREFGRINSLKAIKQNCLAVTPFLFNHDERYFLEVLYLKLSFLGEVIQKFHPGNSILRHPDLRLSTEQIWVKLPEQGGLLPFFWNFRVGFMDISGHHGVPGSSQKPAANSLFFPGLFWFYTLLVNSQQNMQDISGALDKMVFSENNFSYEQLVNETTFLPANIFWQPAGKKVNAGWGPVWEKSVNMGLSLLKGGFQNDDLWNEKEFQQELENLRGEVREKLFLKEISYSHPELPAEDQSADRTGDEAIHGLLMGILARGYPPPNQEDQVEQVKQVKKEDTEDEFRETIILSPQKPGKGDTIPEIKAPPFETETITAMGANKEEDLEKTVILSLKDLEQKPPPPQLKDEPEEDFMDKTVILKPGEKSKSAAKK